MSAAPIDYDALAKQAGAVSSAPASGDVDYDALAKQAGAVSSQPATAPPPAAAKPGMLDTVSDKLEKVSNQPLTSHTAATEAGLANVGQGVVQAVKGAADTFKPAEDSTENTVHALLGPGGLAAYRLGKGLISSAKSGADVPAAISDINASPDPLGTYANVAAKTAGQAGGQAVAAIATHGAVKAVSAANTLRDIPGALSKDTVATFNSVAAKEGLPAVTATTARDAAGELSQNFINRAKATYKVVDDAVGGDLKPVQEKIQNLKTAIRVNQNVNPELADKQTSQLADQQQTLQSLIEKAKANGVPDADAKMAAGDKDYSRGMAMKKVQSGVATASGQAKMKGHPHPGGFASQVDRLERTGTLQRALGQDATDAMVENAKAGLSRTKTVGRVGTAAKLAVGGALAGKAVDVLSGKH